MVCMVNLWLLAKLWVTHGLHKYYLFGCQMTTPPFKGLHLVTQFAICGWSLDKF